MGNWRTSPLFDEREKAVINWAEALTLNTAREDDAAFAAMKEYFTEREIVELTLLSSIFNAWNRFQDGLQVDLEPEEAIIRFTNDW